MTSAPTTAKSYQTIQVPSSHLWNIPEEDRAAPHPSSRRTILLGAVVVGMLIVLVGVTAGSGGPQVGDVPPGAPMMGSSGVRDCSFEECYASGCNHESAPFTCLFHNGGPHGGCSAIPWVKGTCTVQCNLSACDDIVIPPSTPDCDGIKCSAMWCAGGQVCGPDVPYQCIGGSARFGCSDDPLQWTLRTDSVMCSKCCDVSTC